MPHLKTNHALIKTVTSMLSCAYPIQVIILILHSDPTVVTATDDTNDTTMTWAIDGWCSEDKDNPIRSKKRMSTYHGNEPMSGTAYFTPICNCAEWLDVVAKSRVTVSVVLPSGIDTNDMNMELVDRGTVFELQVNDLNRFKKQASCSSRILLTINYLSILALIPK